MWGALSDERTGLSFARLGIKVKVTLRLTVGQSVSLGVEPHLGVMTRYLLLFDSYGLVFVGRPLWREDGSVFCVLLTIASSVFFGSESLGSGDHILLSQFWDFPFRRLLRLAGSRWRYTTPPPYGLELSIIVDFSLYSLGSNHNIENVRCLAMDICEPTLKNTSCNTGSIVACVYCERWVEMCLLYCWLRICWGFLYWVVA
jgi:hypothetical protein